MRITIILTLTLFGFIFLGSANLAYAQDSDIGQSQIHPAHPLYFLKAIKEKMEEYFAKTPKVKMVRQLEFATRRIREVKSLSSEYKSRDLDLIPTTLERYWFHMNTVIQYRPKEEWLTLLLNYTIATHLNVLENIYGSIDEKRAKMSIRTAIYRILNNSDTGGEPRLKGCEFLSREASSAALNEVERAIYKERAQKCYSML